jgi:hypothetical protein
VFAFCLSKKEPLLADNKSSAEGVPFMPSCVAAPATTGTSQTPSDTELRELIARRARELWEQRGRADGHAEEDWLQAETEVLQARQREAASKTCFIVVKFAGSVYTAAYDTEHCEGYRPGELRKGTPVPVRLADDKIYIKRPNGKELEATILKRQPALEAG